MDKPSESFVRSITKYNAVAQKILQSKCEKITIFGYGSLLNKESLLTTTPSATNIRPAILPGHGRIFSLVSARQDSQLGLELAVGNIKSNNLHIAVVSGYPDPSCAGIMGCLFEISSTDFVNWQWREFPYEIVEVKAVEKSSGSEVNALTVVESNDEAVRMKMEGLGDVIDPYMGKVRKYNDKIWGRPGILPVPKYLEACLQGAEDLHGKEGRDNFLDTSYLVDRVTTLREYVANAKTDSHKDDPN